MTADLKCRHIVCDISHPAHVHFFRNAIDHWRQKGLRVDIVSRDKDLTLELLDSYGYRHTCLSRVRRGIAGLTLELVEHEWRLYKMYRRQPPDIFVQIGGTLVVHAARLLRRPAVVFYDTEHAALANAITYPFASAVCTPSCYSRPVRGRHVTYDGYHELAYLHPSRFVPNPAVLEAAGINPSDRFFVMRFVSWDSNHDVGMHGLSAAMKVSIAKMLSKYGRVFVSSETPLPSELAELASPVKATEIHHLLAFAHLYVGESATMASESAVLGVSAIFVSDVGRGYTDEQEKRYGLCTRMRPADGSAILKKAQEIAQSDSMTTFAKSQRENLLSDCIDVTDWMTGFVEQFDVR